MTSKREEDQTKLETAAYTGYIRSSDMVEVLARECLRLRMEISELRQMMRDPVE
ncbi:MAG: hypothetical protein KF833_07935 [Verrucomicrobiae bacterium]|nr:hypothetical protein [Verrucomicrobiae bacterium]